jgi:VIT1/CCC1 family predicted Fe2+/Mn2+ transporter
LADQLMSNKETALDTLVREELGIDPDELGGSAWTAAGASFCLFAVGAVFPILGLLFLTGEAALLAGLIASGLALFAIGTGTSLFTGRGVLFSGARQLLIGFAAAGVTFLIGRLVGVSLAG